MSMIGNLDRIPNETLLKLRQNPELITALLYPDMPAPASEGDHLDLEKSWHGLHFLFTGSDWEGDFPQGFIVTNGEPVGDEDVGYGPARSFTPDEVEEIAAYLDTQNEDALRQRLDPEKMTELEIYPAGLWARGEEEWEYLAENFRSLKQFVKEAAAKRMGLLIYLN